MQESQGSAVERALRAILGPKADSVPFDPSQSPDELAARARFLQVQSGIVPKRGRGSSGGTTPLPEGKGWKPHTGNRQRQRLLRQYWAQFEKRCKKDAWYASTRERLLDAVLDEPEPEQAALNIVMGAKLASDAKKDWIRKNPPPPGQTVSGTEWVDALNHALNQWEKLHESTAAQAVADGAAL